MARFTDCQIPFKHAKLGAFSLLETVIVLSIIALLSLTAVSSFLKWQDKQRQKQLFQMLTFLMHESQEFSAWYGDVVVMCPMGVGEQCGQDWRKGVLLFLDRNHNHQFDTGDKLIKIVRFPFAVQRKMNLNWRGFLGTETIRFSPELGSESSNGTFVYWPSNQVESAKSLRVNRYGRVTDFL